VASGHPVARCSAPPIVSGRTAWTVDARQDAKIGAQTKKAHSGGVTSVSYRSVSSEVSKSSGPKASGRLSSTEFWR
jgi:hypothetical protein